jgi:hypothetical protein
VYYEGDGGEREAEEGESDNKQDEGCSNSEKQQEDRDQQ